MTSIFSVPTEAQDASAFDSEVAALKARVAPLLADEFIQWRQKQITLNILVPNSLPYVGIKEGKTSGYLAEKYTIIFASLGIKANFISLDESSSASNSFIDGSSDMIFAVYELPRYQEVGLLSDETWNVSVGAYMQSAAKMDTDIMQTSGLKIASPHGYLLAETLANLLPDSELILTPSRANMYKMVSDGEADVFFQEEKSTAYFLRRNPSYDLEKKLTLTLPNNRAITAHEFVIRKNFAAVKEAIDIANSQFSPALESAIWEYWLSDNGPKPEVNLTGDERKWIAQHAIIRYGFSQLPPIVFSDSDGNPSGIIPELLALVGEQTGLRFEAIDMPVADWHLATQQRQIDVHLGFIDRSASSSTIITNELFEHSHFDGGVITRYDNQSIYQFADMEGKSIAVMRNTAHYNMLITQFPRTKTVIVDDSLEGLKLVEQSEVDGYFGLLIAAIYTINEHQLFGLKAAATHSDPQRKEAAFVRDDWPELVSIINKALAVIPAEASTQLSEKWFRVRYEQVAPWRKYLPYIYSAVLAMFTIVAVILIWNRRLQKEIDRRISVEQALRVAHDRNEKYLQMVQVLVVVLDRKGTVSLINEAGASLLGYSVEEIIGKNWFEHFLPNNKSNHYSLNRYLDVVTGKSDIMTSHYSNIISRQGGRRNIKWNHSLIYDDEGNISGTLSSGEDITDIKKTNKALKVARNKAEAASKAKSTFLANISHELRTPLNAIIGYTSLLRHDMSLNTEQKQKLSIVFESGNILLDMINDVLELSKIETGKIDLVQDHINLHALAHRLDSMFSLSAKQRNLDFSVEVDMRINSNIVADKNKLQQILINLISNAIKYTDSGWVKFSMYLKDYQAPSTHLVCEVQDSGVGLSEDDIGHIFNPFSQVNHKGREVEGTGLGLSISKLLTAKMGGTLTVKSQKGSGSSFRLCIPVDSTGTEPLFDEQNKSELPAPSSQFSMLIVEENAVHRELLSSILFNAGYRMYEASNQEIAVEQFQHHQPDIVWIDVRIPSQQTPELLRNLKALPHGETAHFVAVTASILTCSKRDFLQAGWDELVNKPFSVNEIHVLAASLLDIPYVERKRDTTIAYAPEYTLSEQHFKTLPTHLMHKLRDAIISLREEDISQVIAEIAEIDDALAQTLQHVSDNFDLHKISSLI